MPGRTSHLVHMEVWRRRHPYWVLKVAYPMPALSPRDLSRNSIGCLDRTKRVNTQNVKCASPSGAGSRFAHLKLLHWWTKLKMRATGTVHEPPH